MTDLTGVVRVGQMWPPADRILFVLAATGKVEKDLLQTWLESSRQSRPHDHVVVFDSGDEALDCRALQEKLADAGDPLVVPIGVEWIEDPNWAPQDLLPFTGRVARTDRDKTRIVANTPERCILVAGGGATLSDLRSRFDAVEGDASAEGAFADFIGRQAMLTVERTARSRPGVPQKLPRFVRRSIEARRDFRADLRALADELEKPVSEVETHASACLKELVSEPTPLAVQSFRYMMRRLVNTAYEPEFVVSPAELEKLQELVRTRPVALVWTHKSHFDGAAFTVLCGDEGLPLPHIFGGINMALPGLSSIARGAGAIFIRRSFQDDPIYKVALRHYIAYLTEKRFPLTWAFEGTRSRTGKLMPPRYGLLKYVVDAALKTNQRDLAVVPISIYYDLIKEVDDYVGEQTGGKKEKESLKWLLGFVRSSLKKPLGRIFFSVGEPVGLEEVTDVGSESPSIDLHKMAFQIAVNTNSATPITPSGLMALALLGASPRALTEDEVRRELAALMRWSQFRNVPVTEDFSGDPVAKFRDIAESMIDHGIVQLHSDGLEEVYSVAPEQQLKASYYRNTVIHVFVDRAIVELALMRAADAGDDQPLDRFWADALETRDLFKFEFFYPDTEKFRAGLIEELSRMAPNWEARIAAGDARAIISERSVFLAHATLRSFVEGYLVVCLGLRAKDAPQDEDAAALVERCLKIGKQAYLQRRIHNEESVAKVILQNGVKLAENRKAFTPNEPSNPEVTRALTAALQDRQRRLLFIESMAMQRRLEPADAEDRAAQP